MLKLSWIPDCQSTQHAKKLVSKAQVWGVVADGRVKFLGGIQIIDKL